MIVIKNNIYEKFFGSLSNGYALIKLHNFQNVYEGLITLVASYVLCVLVSTQGQTLQMIPYRCHTLKQSTQT